MFTKLTGDVQGPLEVTGAVTIDGTLIGGAVVTGKLDLRGTCEGPLEVLLDGQAAVVGVIRGDVHGRGGRLSVRGIIEGRLGVREGADVRLAVGSVLNGRQLQPDGSFVEAPLRGDFTIDDDAPLMRPTQQGNWLPVE